MTSESKSDCILPENRIADTVLQFYDLCLNTATGGVCNLVKIIERFKAYRIETVMLLPEVHVDSCSL